MELDALCVISQFKTVQDLSPTQDLHRLEETSVLTENQHKYKQNTCGPHTKTRYLNPEPSSTHPLSSCLYLCCYYNNCVAGQSCPKGWIQLNNRCLIFVDKEFNFNLAEIFCNTFGGNLVSIHSRLENEVVRHLILAEAGSFQRSWIGFQDMDQEGVFEWTDGSTVDFTDWANNRPRTNSNLNCAEINFRGDSWNDMRCGAERPFVCARNVEY
ncbi:galactose-specific lectin nattectin-like [Dunckerocampus dactyliophorus]|uniref:galactose-specific lectin nattectin-like n=1 Tax=Dunckerocampus dactyliophorus TaxID=161453 RepID=UPI0024067B9E|nr:galactose-specific lectin nattectin-like [Dunckerocampus dactyliophorus]